MTLWLRQQINKKGNHFSIEASLLIQWNVTFDVIFVPYDGAKTNFRGNTCLIYGNNDWLRINFYDWITVCTQLALCIWSFQPRLKYPVATCNDLYRVIINYDSSIKFCWLFFIDTEYVCSNIMQIRLSRALKICFVTQTYSVSVLINSG